MRSGANDIVITEDGCTPLIARLHNTDLCRLEVYNLVFACTVRKGVVLLAEGSLLSVLGKNPVKLRYNMRFGVINAYEDIKNIYELSADVFGKQFYQREVPRRYLTYLSSDFLYQHIVVYERGQYRKFSESDIVRFGKTKCYLHRFATITRFNEAYLDQLRKLSKEADDRYEVCRIPARLTDMSGRTLCQFQVYFYHAPLVISDVDGTLTPADICAFCPRKTEIARTVKNPVLVTSRTFIWRKSTQNIADDWFNGSPVLMFAGSTPLSSSSRVAGKVLAIAGIYNIIHAYGNTKSDHAAFLLSGAKKVSIV